MLPSAGLHPPVLHMKCFFFFFQVACEKGVATMHAVLRRTLESALGKQHGTVGCVADPPLCLCRSPLWR